MMYRPINESLTGKLHLYPSVLSQLYFCNHPMPYFVGAGTANGMGRINQNSHDSYATEKNLTQRLSVAM